MQNDIKIEVVSEMILYMYMHVAFPRGVPVSHVASFHVPMLSCLRKQMLLSFICMKSYVAVANRFFFL